MLEVRIISNNIYIYIYSVIFECIYKENNEIIDFFVTYLIFIQEEQISLFFIVYFNSIAIPFTIIYLQL